jgi:predicted dehydrogenase
MKTIRFGIIGCGLMGREFASAAARWCHLLDVAVKPEITGICDTNNELFGWYKQHFPTISCATNDYKELLARKDIDAIYCAVPHNLHASLYEDIIAAGKHLLGEKPFGIDKAANEKILAAIKKNPNVFVRCSSEFPYFPAVQKIVAAAKEQKFGTILDVESGFHHSSDLDPNKAINWKRMIQFNGEYGCMGDLGMHTLHVPLRLGWIPQDVRAILSNVVKERPGKDCKLVPCETWDNATLHREEPRRRPAVPAHHHAETHFARRHQHVVPESEGHPALDGIHDRQPQDSALDGIRPRRSAVLEERRPRLHAGLQDHHRAHFRIRFHRRDSADVGRVLSRTERRQSPVRVRDTGRNSHQPQALHCRPRIAEEKCGDQN